MTIVYHFDITTRLPGMYDHPVITQQKVHITGKPLPLLKDLLAITGPGSVILDPFLGGGTTAVAALETGRGCIGIERSKEYAKIARNRVEKYLEEKCVEEGN